MWLLKISFLVILISAVNSYNILGVFPYPIKSHAIVFLPLMKALAEKGHNITVISSFPIKEKIPNYTDLDFGREMKSLVNVFDLRKVNADNKLARYFRNPFFMVRDLNKICENPFPSEHVQNFFKSSPKFDAIILECFITECYLELMSTFNSTIIGFSSQVMPPWFSNKMGLSTETSYVPNNFGGFSHMMTFPERLENTLVTAFLFMLQWYYGNVGKRAARKYVNQEEPKLNYINNISLYLINTHFSLNFPRPVLPNIIEVGGIHIGKPITLEENLQNWIDGSKEGIIYISFGSMLNSLSVPKEKEDIFLNVFEKMPHKIIWKTNKTGDDSKKILRQAWLPQKDILCHPNVKLFISHGGLLSITEAVHCGTPMIIIPQYGDQHSNAKLIEELGVGVRLHWTNITEKTMIEAIALGLSEEVLENMKRVSERFADRPMSPLDTAIYWVEYVIRHKGASFMRPASVQMPFYQYYLLDVFLFIGLILFLKVYLIFIVFRILKMGFVLFSRLKKNKQD